MSNSDIKQLIDALMTEVKNSPPDEATVSQLRAFESALEPYLSAGSGSAGAQSAESDTAEPDKADSDDAEESLLDKAARLEVAFAQQHPVAEGITREIINTLSRMGI